MSILKSIMKSFGSKKDEPSIKFGRFSDSYKEAEKYDYWDKSIEKYEQNKYLESFELFLEYLLDDDQSNVTFTKSEDRIDFEMYQGSKKITGYATTEKVKAEAKIAKTTNLNIGFLRRLVEFNFGLKYTRFALDPDSNITVVFDTFMLDGSPYKLYYALKELSINADKQDDILINEFESLHSINTGHLREVSIIEKQTKYDYLHNTLDYLFQFVETPKLSFDKYPGALSYLLLDAIYRLDYFIKPEGRTMEAFEKSHKYFFIKDGKSPEKKNAAILKELKKVKTIEKESFFKELYGIKSTFGITAPSSHDRLSNFIEGEIGNMDWYQDNGHTEVSLSIIGYIIGYCLFNFALPAPDKELLHLYYTIMEQDYFNELGYAYTYKQNNELDKREILYTIEQVIQRHKPDYQKLTFQKKTISFKSELDFAKSFILMVKHLNLSRTEQA